MIRQALEFCSAPQQFIRAVTAPTGGGPEKLPEPPPPPPPHRAFFVPHPIRIGSSRSRVRRSRHGLTARNKNVPEKTREVGYQAGAFDSRRLHLLSTSESTFRPTGRCVPVHPQDAHLRLFLQGFALPGARSQTARREDLRNPPKARIHPGPSLFLSLMRTFRAKSSYLTRSSCSPVIPSG